MRRLTLHLVISLLTFVVGVTIALVLRPAQKVTPIQKVSEVDLDTLQVIEPRAQPIASATPTFVFEYDPKQFNPRGDYFIIGRKPRAFREFDCLELSVDEDLVSGYVTLQTYSNQTYNAAYEISGSVTNKRLTFIAHPISDADFEYGFEGEFLRGGTVSSASKNSAVLRGKLTKSKDGVRLAESYVKLRIEYLGC